MTGLNTSLKTSINQRLSLNQHTKIWLDVISMEAFDLNKHIEDIVKENPFLEIPREYKSFYLKTSDNSFDKNQAIEESVSSGKETLFSHLREQINISFSGKDVKIAENIISFLDKDGYLKVKAEQIAEEISVETKKVKEIIKVLKTFDPYGVCAEDLNESLYIQLNFIESTKYTEIAKEIVLKYLNELSKKDYEIIAKKLNCELSDVKKALNIIQTLEPYPAREYDTQTVKYIVPEIFIYKENGVWSVKTNDKAYPPLQITKKYIKLKEDIKDEKTIKYLEEKKKEALSFMNALNERGKTLFKVGNALLNLQYDFFEKGREYLKPLKLKDIANYDGVSLSLSTISRIASNKYLETVWGTFAIKYFFSYAVRNDLGSRSVKEIIKRIIKESDTKLSDEKTRLILKSYGIDIARRTVSKYRKNMNIFSSRDY